MMQKQTQTCNFSVQTWVLFSQSAALDFLVGLRFFDFAGFDPGFAPVQALI